MKIKIFIAFLIMTTNIAFSQDYMDDITLKTCECLSTVSDTSPTFKIELGLCMINASSPYKKQLKKDYKIDFKKIDKQGEKLGKTIGLRMASVCPSALIKMVNRARKKNNISENIIKGQITAITDEKFVEFSIKNELGKISKYYWLTFIESKNNLSTDYKTFTDKFAQVTFTPKEFFDARIGEYRTFNIIQKLEIINK